MALQKQTFSIPVSGGLDQKTDPFQVESGYALRLENARFQKTKKLSKRFGLSALTTNSSNSLLSSSTVEYIASDDNQLNIVTNTGVYGYSKSYDEWNLISGVKDYAKVNTEFLSKNSLNQYNPDSDYSATFKLMVTTYREREEQDSLKSTSVENVAVVVEDIETGLKQIKRYSLNPQSYTILQQKVIIINNNGQPYIVLCYNTQSSIFVVLLDKYLNESATFIVIPTSYDYLRTKFDIQKDNQNIYLVTMQNTQVDLRKFDFNLNQVLSTVFTATNRLAINTSNIALGFCTYLDSSTLHLFYLSNTTGEFASSIIGVGFDKFFNVTITQSTYSVTNGLNLAITKNLNNIIIAVHQLKADASGSFAYRYSTVKKFDAAISSSYSISIDFADDLRAIGGRLELLSRPFVLNGTNYVLCKSTDSDQRTGMVYNLDSKKASAQFSPFSLSESRSITSVRKVNWSNAVISNGIIYSSFEKLYGLDTDNVANYDFIANQAISKIQVDFNKSSESRTKVKVGETTYVTDGRTYCFDARGCYESGFDLSPSIDYVTQNSSGAANPNVASKTFNYVAVYNFYNGKGELERSISSAVKSITTTSTATYIQIGVKCLNFSYKDVYEDGLSGYTVKQSIDIVLYRTTNNGTIFYRVGNTPNRPINYNQQIEDAVSDTDLANNELLYTNGGILTSDSTPNAKFSVSGGNRIFLGGLEEQDEIAYSKKQLFGEAVSFNDFLRIRVSTGRNADKTPISALGYMDNKLIVFRENSIYFIQGDGPNEVGVGGFSDPEVISSDVGCIEPRSILNIPNGLIFKSKKGIYLLTRGLSTEYIGAAVEDFNSLTTISSLVSDKFNEARFYMSSGDCIIFNFLFNVWSVFKNQTTVDADIWQENPVIIKSNKVLKEVENTYLDDGASGFYSMRFVTPWLKLNLVQSYLRVYRLFIIGNYKSSHTLKLKMYFNYNDATSEDYDLNYNNTEDPQYQFGVHLPIQKVESVKFELYDTNHGVGSSGEAYELSNLQVEVGVKEGGFRLATTKQY